jgi:hypothetical protein
MGDCFGNYHPERNLKARTSFPRALEQRVSKETRALFRNRINLVNFLPVACDKAVGKPSDPVQGKDCIPTSAQTVRTRGLRIHVPSCLESYLLPQQISKPKL